MIIFCKTLKFAEVFINLAKRFKVITALILLMFSTITVANDAQQRDYQAKALFLYNFANFVSWPQEAFAADVEPIHMCLFGDIPFGTILDAVDGALIGDRPLKIIRTNTISDIAEGCQILFVGDERRALLPEFWKQIKYIYVLSVGEQKEFTSRGGIINILRTTDRMQFDVNISNAVKNGLFISSDLLALAREIRRNTESR